MAVDKYSTRLNLVKASCERLGITNVKIVAADSTEYSTEPADKVLLDTPCSGLGVLAKKPDVKLKREAEDIRDLVDLQRRLIENAATLVKAGRCAGLQHLYDRAGRKFRDDTVISGTPRRVRHRLCSPLCQCVSGYA